MATQFITPAGSTIGFSATLPATDDQAGYEALTFTQLDLPTSLGTVGATDNIVNYTALFDAIVQKNQGSRDYGTQEVPMAYSTESNAAVELLETAWEARNSVAVELTLPDGAIRYYTVKCDGIREEIGEADSVLGANTTLHITTKVIKVDAP